jgi:hypothetical protein
MVIGLHIARQVGFKSCRAWRQLGGECQPAELRGARTNLSCLYELHVMCSLSCSVAKHVYGAVRDSLRTLGT